LGSELVLTIVWGIVLVAISLGIPICFSLFFASLVYVVIRHINIVIFAHQAFSHLNNFLLICIPLFMLMGQLMNESGITNKLVEFAKSLVGHLSGGLAQVNIVTSMFNAGLTGSSTADASMEGSILIPVMIKDGYSASFSAAVTAASSTIGPIIPPSILMIIYAAYAHVSVIKLFLGGVIPGICMGLFMMFSVSVIARKRNYSSINKFSLKRLIITFKEVFPCLLIPIIIVFGILMGIFTPTEAAGVAVIVTILIAVFIYRSLSLNKFLHAIVAVTHTCGPLLFVIPAAVFFGSILIREGFIELISSFIIKIAPNYYIFFLLINLLLLVLGCFLDSLAILLVAAPIIIPIIELYNIDPVHFGVIMVLNLMIGQITPPVGMSMLVSCSIANVKVEEFTKEIFPFFLALIVNLLLMTYVPSIITFLPNCLIK